MQRQKTIAKWLVIILLVTVAVGAYIMYDALYLGGDTAEGGSTTEAPSPTPDPVPEPEPPYYTTLPRPVQNYGGIAVSHAGGEGDDVTLGTVFTAERVFLFFSSASNEFDCRGAGTYLAVFSDDELLSVTRIGGENAVFGGAKLTGDGVAALLSEDGAGRLLVFDDGGGVKGETELPPFTAAFPLLAEGRLAAFLSTADGLSFLTVEKGLTPSVSPFRYPARCEVKGGFFAGGSFALAAENDEDIIILSFSQNSGFKCSKTYDKTDFLQLVPVAGEDGAAFAVLGSKGESVLLAVLSAEGDEVAATVREGGPAAALFGDGVSLTLVRPGLTETFCRHLDLISSSPSALDFDAVAAARESGDARVLIAVTDGNAEVLLSENGGDFLSLAAWAYPGGNVAAEIVGGTLFAAFSSSSADGVFFENFGGADAWHLCLPL